MNNMETEVEGIQTRCFSRCFAAINEMKIVIVTIYNFQEQQKTNFPPFPFTYRLERGEEGSILEIPARFSTTNGLAIFLRLLPLFHRPMFEPVLEKLRDDTIAVIREEGRDFTDNGTRSDNYLPRTRFRIPWI